MKYKETSQLGIEFKKILLDKKINQRDVADKMGISPQGLAKLFNKKNFSFDDMQRILDAIDYELHIDFVEKK